MADLRSPQQVEVIHRERLYDGFFKLDATTVRYERYDGTMSPPMTRLILERGDAVAVLLHDLASDSVILTEQFRYPAHLRGQTGWLLEVVAGMAREGEDLAEVARREALEETGYQLDHLEFVATFFLSPGGTTERVHLYYAPVSGGQRIAPGGGVLQEQEDIRVVALPLAEAWQMVQEGRICDAKTIVAFQWLKLRQKVE